MSFDYGVLDAPEEFAGVPDQMAAGHARELGDLSDKTSLFLLVLKLVTALGFPSAKLTGCSKTPSTRCQ